MEHIYENLKKLKLGERKAPMHIYLDEKTGQIVEEPLSDMQSAGAAINPVINPAGLIHQSIFGYE
jgi:hypothetical protein